MSATTKAAVTKSAPKAAKAPKAVKPAAQKKEQLPAPPALVKVDLKDAKKEETKKAMPARADLIAAGEDMNAKMGLEPAINVKLNAQAIIRDILHNAADLDFSDFNGTKAPEEQISDATKATLSALGFVTPIDPAAKKKAEKPAAKVKSSTDMKAEKAAKKADKAPKKARYTRANSVVDVLKKATKKPLSLSEIQTRSDELYAKHGGDSTATTDSAKKYRTRLMLDVLVAFNALEITQDSKGKDAYKLVNVAE